MSRPQPTSSIMLLLQHRIRLKYFDHDWTFLLVPGFTSASHSQTFVQITSRLQAVRRQLPSQAITSPRQSTSRLFKSPTRHTSSQKKESQSNIDTTIDKLQVEEHIDQDWTCRLSSLISDTRSSSPRQPHQPTNKSRPLKLQDRAPKPIGAPNPSTESKLMKRSRNQRGPIKMPNATVNVLYSLHHTQLVFAKSPLYIDFELATASKPRQTSLVTPQLTSNLTFNYW